MENYLKTHLLYIILIIGGVMGFHIWLQEHDLRLQDDKVVAVSEAQVKTLQSQIQTIQQQAMQKTAVVTRIVQVAKTPAQQIAAIPQLTDVPLNARAVPNNPSEVTVDLAPLVQVLAQAAMDKVNLQACTDTLALQVKELAAKDVVIVALKRKPKFLTRVKHWAVLVGTGVGIGMLVLGAHK